MEDVIKIVYETHSISVDNELHIATGWLPGRLSNPGMALARELGERRRSDGIDAVFTSDLRRAVQTAEIAFDGTKTPILHDWRLRECDYGALNGAAVELVHSDRLNHLDVAYPDGESWRGAIARVAGFLDDLPSRWAGARVLVIGHVATRFAFDNVINGVPLAQMLSLDFAWQEGWEYCLRAVD